MEAKIQESREPRTFKNVILASYFNHTKDRQRNKYWKPQNHDSYAKLRKSINDKGIEFVVLSNTFMPHQEDLFTIEQVKADTRFTPNAFRWFAQLDWLEKHRPEKVFMLDIDDVEMWHDPFPHLEKGKLYAGYEYDKNMYHNWMWNRQAKYLAVDDWRQVVQKENGDKRLLNTGIFGGYTEDVIDFLQILTTNHKAYSPGLKTSSDMSLFNYTVLKYGYWDKIGWGSQVASKFKKYEVGGDAWFRHK
ncbi:hypothetical protein [Blastopirellula marina]|uniref:Glycosyltransferase n=1 Tax=Blastopirellula marina DSM 3645 TaxID=314230 RepID=A4A262_9BACT|nr:hypothetical protein [Blastopirellula marina]EAQ77165.1 hypothetical protein DSM3645_15215 [Blastopirellula marina DSM 3645]